MNDPVINDLSHCARLWLGPVDSPNQVRLFRRVFEVRNATIFQHATMQLFADARYLFWVNGHFVGRGPAFFHPHRMPYDTYDLRGLLREGRNALAVLVHSPGVSLNNYTATGRPGLTAQLALHDADGTRTVIGSDRLWKCSAQSGWNEDTPRRCWALGCIEHFDATLAPSGWQDVEFDDDRWAQADLYPSPTASDVQVFPSPLPGLQFDWSPAVRMTATASVSANVFHIDRNQSSADYGQSLMTEEWRPLRDGCVTVQDDAKGLQITVKGMRADEGVALVLDLGVEKCGHPMFELIAPSVGTIDCGCAELLEGQRPAVLRKGNSYANRYRARPGTQEWMPHNYMAGRYLLLVLRGFEGDVRLTRVGMLASEPALEWRGKFDCDDAGLNQLFQICERSLRVGTQECMMDCPTREQTLYVGDGILTGDWLARLTGDVRHWRYLLAETFEAQSPEGLIKTTTFSGRNYLLIDYELWAVIGVRDYLREVGDLDRVRQWVPGCRRVIEWFRARQTADGLLDLSAYAQYDSWVKAPGTALAALKDPGMVVFIDHPGLGWHNQNEPGIDRRGVNAAMNALLVMALRALSELLCAIDDNNAAKDYAQQADQLARKAESTFWNANEKAFSDGLLNGQVLPQISQQTNTLCLAAGFNTPVSRRDLLIRILDQNDADLARSGPYFWAYMYPLLVGEGLGAEAMSETRRLWGVMLKSDATTLWETFAGDHLDSYCHPWSAAPMDFFMRYVAGIGPLPLGTTHVVLRPRMDLLKRVQTCVVTPRGAVCIAWESDGKRTTLRGSLPADVTGVLELPGGERKTVQGEWRV